MSALDLLKLFASFGTAAVLIWLTQVAVMLEDRNNTLKPRREPHP